MAGARGELSRARRGTSGVPGAGASLAAAAGASDLGGLLAVKVLDGRLDRPRERLALHELVQRALRFTASQADADREL